MVFLITGKPGSGKSHYALRLSKDYNSKGNQVIWLDGDAFRNAHGNFDFSDAGREDNLRLAADQAAEYESRGFIVICSFVSPKKEWRDMMRSYWDRSYLIYLPGGKLWAGTTYEIPDEEEWGLRVK
jgi:adenylylsulfate kinase-like enzyme